MALMLQRVAKVMEVEVQAIMSPGAGTRLESKARNAFCFLVDPIMRHQETATILGRRAHTTIAGAGVRCQMRMRKDHEYCVRVMSLVSEFEGERRRYAVVR